MNDLYIVIPLLIVFGLLAVFVYIGGKKTHPRLTGHDDSGVERDDYTPDEPDFRPEGYIKYIPPDNISRKQRRYLAKLRRKGL